MRICVEMAAENVNKSGTLGYPCFALIVIRTFFANHLTGRSKGDLD